MGDIFNFEDESLSKSLNYKLKIDDVSDNDEIGALPIFKNKIGNTDSNETEQVLLGPPVINFKKARSNSVISVGSINNRLGTSYEVGIDDEVYLDDGLASRENSKASFMTYTDDELSRFKNKHIKKKVTIQDFEPIKVLGKGTYGKVILVKDKRNGKLYAQKQLKKASMIVDATNYERTLTERTILERVKHPNIVKLYYALQDFDKVYLILEYLEGGELFTHLAQERIMSEKVACYYLAEIILALRHLHTNVGVVYRDLKPENCMLNRNGHLVLTDFGLSKVSTGEDSKCNTLTGTAYYMAPEIIKGEPYDYQCDWWSVGAVAYDLLTGSPPFTGNNNKKIMDKITTQKLKPPFYLTNEAKDLLHKLLNKNPEKRLNCDKDFEKVKNHPFFRYINWDKIIIQDNINQPPPIIPVVTNPELAENFDSEFTSMAITPPSSPYNSYLDQLSERENSTGSFITIKKPIVNGDSSNGSEQYTESVYFNNFSYTHEDDFLHK